MNQKTKSISHIILPFLIVLFFIGCNSTDTVVEIPGGTVKDVEGNVYKTVTIGSQTWMAENLRSIKLTDGSQIPYISDKNSWSLLTSPGYSYYSNDSISYKYQGGALYNWYTINTKKLCPAGWHVPSENEWTTLISSLGVDSIAGGKLKSTGTISWISPNTAATNSTGFNALPSGYRFYNGSYNNFYYSGNWWTSTEYSATAAKYCYLVYNKGNLGKNYLDKQYGFSVRCIKD
jgi:uncharacterized protein (TIGR02145 family)